MTKRSTDRVHHQVTSIPRLQLHGITLYRQIQLVYDCDGVRVVETEVSLCSQESFEVVPEWQQGEPVPRYLPPSKGTLRRLADAVREGLGLKESSPPPSPADQRAQNIANTVRRRHSIHLPPGKFAPTSARTPRLVLNKTFARCLHLFLAYIRKLCIM